jgi:hypothetical protein
MSSLLPTSRYLPFAPFHQTRLNHAGHQLAAGLGPITAVTARAQVTMRIRASTLVAFTGSQMRNQVIVLFARHIDEEKTAVWPLDQIP